MLSLSVPIDKLKPEYLETLIKMLSRAKLETTQCFKFAMEQKEKNVIESNKRKLDVGSTGTNAAVARNAVNAANAAERAGNPEASRKAEEGIRTIDRTVGAIAKAGEVTKSNATLLESSAERNKKLLAEIGFGKYSVEEVLADASLRTSVKRALEKNGKDNELLYGVILSHENVLKDVQRANDLYEKTFGQRMDLSGLEINERGAKSSKLLRALSESLSSETAQERSNETSRIASLSSQSISATKAYDISKPGETVQISSSVSATKTESGGIVVETPSGKLKFDYKEAKGAMNEIDILERAGAAFLIPAMKEIAANTGIQLKNGVSREEASRMLATLAKAFGMNDVANETDPRALLIKFKTVASGALGGGDLSERARKLGFVDDMGTLKPNKVAEGLEKHAELEKREKRA